MDKPRLAWAITGSGHYIKECLDFLLTLNHVDLYLSQAGEEVLKMYGVDLADIRAVMPVYRDKAASSPPVGHFYKGYYHLFYQLHPFSDGSGPKYWGHVRSRDLVKWEPLPIALAPKVRK